MTTLQATHQETVAQICNDSRAIIDHEFYGDELIIQTAGDDHPSAADTLHSLDWLRYMKTVRHGENAYGTEQYALHFNVDVSRQPDVRRP